MKDSPNTLGIGSKYKFNQQYSRNALVSMIVNHEYPLAMVDHIGFKRYSNSLNPDFKVISRNTVKADIFREYNEEWHWLEKVLARNKSRIAFTSDIWTYTNQRKGFLYLPCPHNKYTISKILVECLKSFNLDENISTITLDNCTTNDVVVDVLLEKLQPSSLCYGLEIISGAIEKVRSVVVFCTSSPNRYEKFEDACNYCKTPITKKLQLDCKTRWNSCSDMLQIALLYKDAFTRLESKVGKSEKEKFRLPSKEEWKMASDICDKLTLFSRTTEAFSYTAKLECERIGRILKDLVNEYETHVSSQPNKKPRKCELDIYLDEERLVVDKNKFNLLAWWNAESSKFPTLSKIARDILAMPISTVASESAFSTSDAKANPLQYAPIFEDEDVEDIEEE
ncbi:zinc finger BED domain-containing protein RICESLEEPER 2-like [Amaranthus tricolor]|uniref:zinc finger BED domain-containing protein RICESLEEPER 2-like n=1 Tax=Amaranthus tricolor TaxID=29722 RepID=UPI00258DAC03|nr:zinc finger BED domain-containing protein RICESLEEPER 2-like [Amaranthus tricolor]